jgi:hypothetical protein
MIIKNIYIDHFDLNICFLIFLYILLFIILKKQCFFEKEEIK